MDDYPRSRPRYRVSGSPAPRALGELNRGPAAPPIRIARSIERSRPVSAPVSAAGPRMAGNPVYRHQLGIYRWKKHGMLWLGASLALCLTVPVLKLCLSNLSGVNPANAFYPALLGLNLLVWFGAALYSLLIADLTALGLTKNLLRDLYLSALKPAEVGEAILRGRLNRLALLVGALLPFELLVCYFGFFLNSGKTRMLFSPLALTYFLVDLYIVMTLNLSAGMRFSAVSRSRNEALLKTYALHLLGYTLLFGLFTNLYIGFLNTVTGRFSEALFVVAPTAGISIMWPGGAAILFLIVGRLLYLALFRAGFAIRSQSLYRRHFKEWLRNVSQQ